LRATARAHPNIALVKYWGKRDVPLNLPAVPSLSMTLERYVTKTSVTWGADADSVTFDGKAPDPRAAKKIFAFLDLVHPQRPRCAVETSNNFPAGAGLASSSSGFAALALAAAGAAGVEMDTSQLSVLARMGSGSACRSLWGGFVEWRMGTRADGADSHGIPVADEDWWPLRMVVAVVSANKKPVGSTDGMERSRKSSPYYPTWVATAEDDVRIARDAILARDLQALGEVMESSTFKMHAAMHTTKPPLIYWLPGTVAVLHAVAALRRDGVGAWATMDAGPNVKILCVPADVPRVQQALKGLVDTVDVLGPGPGPVLKVYDE
jgi:diphosphomevalonate decarboxylase